MSSPGLFRALPLLVLISPLAGAAGGSADACREQAGQVVERLQAEVVGDLSADQQERARRIVSEACQAQTPEATVPDQQAAQPAPAQDESGSGFWSSGSPDKPGNERLKRRGRY